MTLMGHFKPLASLCLEVLLVVGCKSRRSPRVETGEGRVMTSRFADEPGVSINEQNVPKRIRHPGTFFLLLGSGPSGTMSSGASTWLARHLRRRSDSWMRFVHISRLWLSGAKRSTTRPQCRTKLCYSTCSLYRRQKRVSRGVRGDSKGPSTRAWRRTGLCSAAEPHAVRRATE